MRVFLIAVLLKLSLFASTYPLVYASIGDEVYATAKAYKTLLGNEIFHDIYDDLREYVLEAELLMEDGFRLEHESVREDRKKYVKTLRELAKEKKRLDFLIQKYMDEFYELKAYALLQELSDNDLAYIRNSKAVRGAMEHSLNKEENFPKIEEFKGDSLEENLQRLKEELIVKREENAPIVACLNDLTAINYWMIRSEKEFAKSSYCEAVKASDQVIKFNTSAKISCVDYQERLKKWQERSMEIRGKKRFKLISLCQEDKEFLEKIDSTDTNSTLLDENESVQEVKIFEDLAQEDNELEDVNPL